MVAMSNTGSWIIVGFIFAVIYAAGIFTPYLYHQIRGK